MDKEFDPNNYYAMTARGATLSREEALEKLSPVFMEAYREVEKSHSTPEDFERALEEAEGADFSDLHDRLNFAIFKRVKIKPGLRLAFLSLFDCHPHQHAVEEAIRIGKKL